VKQSDKSIIDASATVEKSLQTITKAREIIAQNPEIIDKMKDRIKKKNCSCY